MLSPKHGPIQHPCQIHHTKTPPQTLLKHIRSHPILQNSIRHFAKHLTRHSHEASLILWGAPGLRGHRLLRLTSPPSARPSRRPCPGGGTAPCTVGTPSPSPGSGASRPSRPCTPGRRSASPCSRCASGACPPGPPPRPRRAAPRGSGRGPTFWRRRRWCGESLLGVGRGQLVSRAFCLANQDFMHTWCGALWCGVQRTVVCWWG